MFNIKIDKHKKSPIYKQIIDEIIRRVSSGLLRDGFQMPSSRKLAKILGVSRTTVCLAYEELIALGYLISKEGSYTYVKGKLDYSRNFSKDSIILWENLMSENIMEFQVGSEKKTNLFKKKDDFIDMRSFLADKRLFPIENFRKVFNNTLKKKGPEIFTYGNPFGYQPLRNVLAKNFSNYGINIKEENILITSGALNAIKMITELLISEGDSVLIESPTYHTVIPILKASGAKIFDVKMCDNGIDLVEVEKILNHNKIKFIYTMPNFHNPTGITTSNEHRKKLLDLSVKYKVPILEDGFDDEMKFFGKVPMSLKAMDLYQTVIYIGTFSKVLFPGLRIGWIVADTKLIKLLSNVKKYNYLVTNKPVQAVMADFIDRGFYDLHLKKVFRVYRRRMKTAIKFLKLYFKEPQFHFIEPSGGYHVWIEMASIYTNLEKLEDKFNKNGVSVLIGDICFYKKVEKIYIRVSFGQLNEEEIIEGLKRVKNTLVNLRELC